jgi:P-type Cu2+ transporter
VLTGEYLPQARIAGDAVTAGTLNVEGALTVEVQALGDNTRLSAIVRPAGARPVGQTAPGRAGRPVAVVPTDRTVDRRYRWYRLVAARPTTRFLDRSCPAGRHLSLRLVAGHPDSPDHSHRHAAQAWLVAHPGTCAGRPQPHRHGDFRQDRNLDRRSPDPERGSPTGELDADACLELAAALENRSEHPIARAFGRAPQAAEAVDSVPGLGLQGSVAERTLRIGQPDFVAAGYAGAAPEIPGNQGQWLLLGDTQGPLAWLVLERPLRDDAPALLQACKARGWKTVLLSGDSSPMVGEIAQQLGIEDAHGGMTPTDKLTHLQRLQAEGRRVLMLGDGVNDAPVLAAADISVAMGSATDLAKTSADAVLLQPPRQPGAGLQRGAPKPPHHHRKPAWASLYNGLICRSLLSAG